MQGRSGVCSSWRAERWGRRAAREIAVAADALRVSVAALGGTGGAHGVPSSAVDLQAVGAR
jgi:hypothetical protein